MITPWVRSTPTPGARNVFQLFCFAKAPLLADVPMSAQRFGVPVSADVDSAEVRELPRAVDPRWFDGFRGGALRVLAERTLGSVAALDEADLLCAVLIDRPDSDTLSHLQAGWGLAQWLVARGATVVLDAQTNRFWRGADVAQWPANRPFALSVEVNVVVEAEPGATVATVHTRGLQKFGRPDLVVLDVPAPRWNAVAALVRVLAGEAAAGRCFRPGDVAVVGEERVRFERFAPAPGAELHLNNDALVLVPG